MISFSILNGAKDASSAPLIGIAAAKRPAAEGIASRFHTEVPPELCPAIVTLVGSPPAKDASPFEFDLYVGPEPVLVK